MAGHRVHARAPAARRLAPHALLVVFCGGPLRRPGARARRSPGRRRGAVAAALAAGGLAAPRPGRRGARPARRWRSRWRAGRGAPRGWRRPRRRGWTCRRARAGSVVVDAPPAPDGRGGCGRGRWPSGCARRPAGRSRAGRACCSTSTTAAGRRALGERLRVEGRLRPAATRDDPGWWRRWLARQGIAGRLRPRGGRAGRRRGGLEGAARPLARGGRRRRRRGPVGRPRRRWCAGWRSGAGRGCRRRPRTAFRDAGLWHLLAVSGQNVTVVALAALALLRALGARRRVAVAGAAAAMAAYCLACDGGASVARAGIVGGLGLVGRAALGAAGAVVPAAGGPRAAARPPAAGDRRPRAAALVRRGGGPVPARAAAGGAGCAAGCPGGSPDLAAMAAAAGLATAPVLVWQFGRLSLAGLALNVVAVPLAAPVVVLALAGIAAGALAAGRRASRWPWVAGLGGGGCCWRRRGRRRRSPGAAVDLPGVGRAGSCVPPRRCRRWLALALAARAAGARLRAAARGAALAARRRRPRALAGLGAARARPAAALARRAGGDGARRRPGRRDPAAQPRGVGGAVRRGPARAARPGGGGARAARRAPPRRARAHPRLARPRGRGDGRAASGWTSGSCSTSPPPEDGFAPGAPSAWPTRRGTAGSRCGEAAGRVARDRRGPLGRAGALAGARPAAGGQDPNPSSLVALASAGALDVLLTADAESDALAPAGAAAGGRAEGVAPRLRGPGPAGRCSARLRPAAALISAGEGNPFRHPRARDARGAGGRGGRGVAHRPVGRRHRDGLAARACAVAASR